MTTYTELLASLNRNRDQSLDAHVPEDWMQGRTTYGGLTAALSFQGALGLVDDIPLRSAQVAFVGPVGGDITIKPTLLRRGKNTAFVSVDVVAESGVTRSRSLPSARAGRVRSILTTCRSRTSRSRKKLTPSSIQIFRGQASRQISIC